MASLKEKRSYKILIFSWNTCSVKLCETNDPVTSATHREGYLKDYLGNTMTLWRYNCEVNDFWNDLSQLITSRDPDVVVFGFQEDRRPGSYFHSHFLPVEMIKLEYTLLKRTTMMGIGVTTAKNIHNDPLVRGLRNSIYVRKSLSDLIRAEETEIRASMPDDGQKTYICPPSIIRGKGAIASYVQIPYLGRLAFINCHLPFDASSLIESKSKDNPMIRQNAVFETHRHYNNILESLVLNTRPQPVNVFYFGDFNYRVHDFRKASEIESLLLNKETRSATIQDIYHNGDELKQHMNKRNIYRLSEGPDGSGPNFVPTCKLLKNPTRRDVLNGEPSKIKPIVKPGRPDQYWNLGKHDQRIPSWCDRILHGTTDTLLSDVNTSPYIECLEYSSFDVGNVMTKSDHSAVYAVYSVSPDR